MTYDFLDEIDTPEVTCKLCRQGDQLQVLSCGSADLSHAHYVCRRCRFPFTKYKEQ